MQRSSCGSDVVSVAGGRLLDVAGVQMTHNRIYIYIYTRVDPCISMHRAEMSRARCSESSRSPVIIN